MAKGLIAIYQGRNPGKREGFAINLALILTPNGDK